MASLKDTLELTGVKAWRVVKKSTDEPTQYCTFQRILRRTDCAASDTVTDESDIYKVALFSKDDFEEFLDKTVQNLKSAGFLVNSIDTELYENDTGYYHVPLTVQEVKE